MFAFVANTESALSFSRGDRLFVMEKCEEEGWNERGGTEAKNEGRRKGVTKKAWVST